MFFADLFYRLNEKVTRSVAIVCIELLYYETFYFREYLFLQS